MRSLPPFLDLTKLGSDMRMEGNIASPTEALASVSVILLNKKSHNNMDTVTPAARILEASRPVACCVRSLLEDHLATVRAKEQRFLLGGI